MKKHFFLLLLVVGLFFVGGLTSSCKKTSGLSLSNITFSVDTLLFDTVFTTLGSTTQQFKIYNPDSKTVIVQEVELMGGKNSPFRVNLDGVAGTKFENLSIEGKDSLFAFVDVKLNVNNQPLPMVVEDSIRVRTNGKDYYLNLVVWGQDAYFHNNETLTDDTWKNDKPHVIFGRVIVDSAKTLTIPAGTKIHLHKNGLLLVYKGAIHVEGTKDKPVIFQGDRLESFYKDVSGQYFGIWLYHAQSSNVNYAEIRNGTCGIQVTNSDPSNTKATLTITNTKIENHASYGLFLYENPSLKMENCVLAKNDRFGLFILQGASYYINHCDLLDYGQNENSAALVLKNSFSDPATKTTKIADMQGTISNSVIYGAKDYEVLIDTISALGVKLQLNFTNCLIKWKDEQTSSNFKQIIWNQSPIFKDPSNYDFHFELNSPLNGNADPVLSIPFDIEGNPRSLSAPDIGAYEMN